MIGEHDLKALLTLRDLDQQTDRLRERALVIPRELERIDNELRHHQESLDERTRELAELRLDRRAAEREIDSLKSKRREIENQQARIRNNQEYQANLREIENMKEKVSLYDDKTLEILVREEEIQKEIEGLTQVVTEQKRKHDGLAGQLSAELATVRAALEGKEAERQTAVERLSPPLRSRYERIRRSKGDLAIVGVDAGACGGCGYALPPQRLQEVRRNRDIVLCEGCGRILVASPDD